MQYAMNATLGADTASVSQPTRIFMESSPAVYLLAFFTSQFIVLSL